MAEKTLNTIIVLRNGTKEAWEADGSYILTTGEVGVGYMTVTVGEGITATTKTVPIVKIGDGTTAWKDLPQAEGVFEKDVVLTAPLGKYTPTSAGYIKIPNSAGMTTSELLLDALSEVKEPTITAPTFTLTATQPGTVEVGTSIATLKFNGTFTNGIYEYGSVKGDTTYSKDDGSGQTASYAVTCTLPGGVDQKKDGSVALTDAYVVGANASNFASVTSVCSWTASERTPFNNVGVETSGILGEGSSSKTVSYSVTAYREGFFYGTSTDVLTAEDLTSSFIRGLSRTKAKYVAGTKELNTVDGEKVTLQVPVGTNTIIFACPAANTGVTEVLNTTVNAKMMSSFTKHENIMVGGADATSTDIGDYSEAYNVWTYSPASAYETAANLKVTLG
jgi:hypothetical protein